MSWQEINKKYPKAWNIYMNWFSEQNYGENLDFAFNRDLYDFFDEQEIFIWIGPEIQYTREIDENDNNPHYCIDDWGYDIHDHSYTLASGYECKTRQEAEQAAFEKAFEILENKLKEWQ